MVVLSAPAHASNISEITADQYVMRCLPDLATLIASDPIAYGFTATDLTTAYVSSAFTIDGSEDGIFYYAIMSNNRALGILSVVCKNGKCSMSYAIDFADVLTQGLTGNQGFSLEWTGETTPKIKTMGTVFSRVAVSSTNVRSSLDTMLSPLNVATVVASENDFNWRGELNGTLPLIDQEYGQYEDGKLGYACSVACAKSMAQYFVSSLSEKTLREVIMEVYGLQYIHTSTFDGYQRAPEVFTRYTNNSFIRFAYGFDLDTLKNQIDADNPIMCIAVDPNSPSAYHCTVIKGYTYGSTSFSYMIKMMDPYTPSWRTVFWDGTGDLTYEFNGGDLIWGKSIVLYS